LLDLRAWSLLIPAIAATVGAVAYAAQGFAVSNGGILPAAWVTAFTAWGGVALALGCEGGTLSALVEVARKRRDGDASPFDRLGITISFFATVTARMLALSNLRGTEMIVALVLTSALDAYVLFAEFGDYAAIRDRNIVHWETARYYYEQCGDPQNALAALHGDRIMPVVSSEPKVVSSEPQVVSSEPQVVSSEPKVVSSEPKVVSSEPKVVSNGHPMAITIDQWRAIASGLNGDRPTTGPAVNQWLSAHGYERKPLSTANRWARL
jgi:hypothetical protein